MFNIFKKKLGITEKKSEDMKQFEELMKTNRSLLEQQFAGLKLDIASITQ